MVHHWPKELLIWHSTVLSDGTFNYHYIVTNNINSLLICSKCSPNDTHTNNHWWNNLAHASKLITNSDTDVHLWTFVFFASKLWRYLCLTTYIILLTYSHVHVHQIIQSYWCSINCLYLHTCICISFRILS